MSDALRRYRRRRDSLKIDKVEIATRVCDFARIDQESMQLDREARLQRYAKFRQWRGGTDTNWPGSSDQSVPDMMSDSLRTQDTLHNAVMSTRPCVTSRALRKDNADKQQKVDDLIDFQMFVEQPGEKWIGEMAECFVNDGVVRVYLPWIREQRPITDLRIFPDTIDDQYQGIPTLYFKELLGQTYPHGEYLDKGEGWDWLVTDEDGDADVSFYTKDDSVEMLISRDITVCDGPRPIVKDYEDVLYPNRSANLQIPGPSNPGGAPHVILVDYPTIDEILRLEKQGYYDLLDEEKIDYLQNLTRDTTNDQLKAQKDIIQGTQDPRYNRNAKTQGTLTRYQCFDLYDLDGDGIAEDVVWWVLLEPKFLLKAKPLTEMWPYSPPRRPLASSSFIEIKGREAGIGLLEIMEGMHDLVKQILDQTIDNGTLQTTPFFFYRPASNVKPEVYRMGPGDGMPLSDPQRDIYFPNLQNSSAAFGLNLLTMTQQWSERLTLTGDLQYGRVPAGKSSALRTLGGIQTILGQGEARPERILRRFFMCLTEIWAQVHELNLHFMPEEKKFRVSGYSQPGADPYKTIKKGLDIDGRFMFDFNANVMNSSKAALQQGLNDAIGKLVNPLTIQLGVSDADTISLLLRDYMKSIGLNPDKGYLKQPPPGSTLPLITAEDAIAQIMDTQAPYGQPLEGAQAHFAKVQEFFHSDAFGHLKPAQLPLFKAYMQQIAALAQQEARQQQMMQAAAQFQQAQQPGQGGGGGAGMASVPPNFQANPMVQPNELIAEDLPGSGGGAVQ